MIPMGLGGQQYPRIRPMFVMDFCCRWWCCYSVADVGRKALVPITVLPQPPGQLGAMAPVAVTELMHMGRCWGRVHHTRAHFWHHTTAADAISHYLIVLSACPISGNESPHPTHRTVASYQFLLNNRRLLGNKHFMGTSPLDVKHLGSYSHINYSAPWHLPLWTGVRYASLCDQHSHRHQFGLADDDTVTGDRGPVGSTL